MVKFVRVSFDHFHIKSVRLAPNRFIVWLVESVRVGIATGVAHGTV